MPVSLICPKCGAHGLAEEGAAARCAACGEFMALDPDPRASARLTQGGRRRLAVRAAMALLVLLCLGSVTGVGVRQWLLTRRGARDRSFCLSSLRQVELALLMYAADYNQMTPAADAWPGLLYPYTRNYRVCLCPADERERKHEWPVRFPDGSIRKMEISYAQNAGVNGQPLTSFASPGDTVLHCDGLSLAGGPESLDPRHYKWLRGANVGYLDGHVAWRHPSSLKPENWQAR